MMTHKFVDLWGWVNRSRAEARQAGDEARIRLGDLHREAWRMFEEDPRRALALYNEGVQLAERLQEPCWLIFHKYWRVEAFLFSLNDMKEGKRQAVDLAVEARKSVYEHCPIRARIYRILVDSYLFSDPIGYAELIQENLDYLEHQVPLDKDTWQLIPARRCALAICFDQFEDARRHALVYLERSQGDDFRLSDSYQELCRISFEFRDMDRLLEYAEAGEIHARRIERKRSIANMLNWQAICHELNNREKEAKRLIHQAQRCLSKLGRATGALETLAWYYEIRGEFKKALEERAKMIASAQKRGGEHDEIEMRIEYCKLLSKMGLPIEEEATKTRSRAKQMLKPDHYLRKLDALESSKM